MKGIPTLRARRLKQAVVLAGVTALVAAGAVLGAGTAHAAGSNPVADLGNGKALVTASPASGPTTGTVTFNSPACPTGSESAELFLVDNLDPTGSQQLIAPVANSVGTPFTFTSSEATSTAINLAAAALPDDPANGIAEVVVECFTGTSGGGIGTFTDDDFLQFDATDSNYTQVANPGVSTPPVSVNLTVTASPNPATSGQQVTLTATASAPNATGTVQFEVNGADINGPANLSGATTSTASTITTPATVTAQTTDPITAIYTPSGNFTAGTVTPGTLTLNPPPVNPTTASGSIPLAVSVPLSGTFSLTVNTTTWVVLGVNSTGTVATGSTTPIIVTDTYNSYPGWSVTGQATQWTGVTNPAAETPSGYPAATDIPADHGSQSIPADELGWAPTSTGTLPTGVTVDTTGVAAGTGLPGTTTVGTGLGDIPQTLATGAPGSGSYTGTGGVTLGANLTLDIPSGQEEGPYAAFLDIDATSGTP
jgi:trimeric autotransporter adhesin